MGVTVSESIDGVFIYLHKTNAWTLFDNAENRTKTICRSFDRVTGIMHDLRKMTLPACFRTGRRAALLPSLRQRMPS